ncbi:hypothetical protein [Metaclostridioides mangenotii]|uniref:Uncharacterized protein n=1 Tax=Metaclostridioides mangenotii TaxID=1540 RepID=A0ABS4E6Y8_9FIRM|nr:hypothetical protein [Clostridioides mangenotii]MBP1853705.1 hypothetical protein [Clostridioides mangenotii]
MNIFEKYDIHYWDSYFYILSLLIILQSIFFVKKQIKLAPYVVNVVICFFTMVVNVYQGGILVDEFGLGGNLVPALLALLINIVVILISLRLHKIKK